jgi:hypothetical protein
MNTIQQLYSGFVASEILKSSSGTSLHYGFNSSLSKTPTNKRGHTYLPPGASSIFPLI